MHWFLSYQENLNSSACQYIVWVFMAWVLQEQITHYFQWLETTFPVEESVHHTQDVIMPSTSIEWMIQSPPPLATQLSWQGTMPLWTLSAKEVLFFWDRGICRGLPTADLKVFVSLISGFNMQSAAFNFPNLLYTLFSFVLVVISCLVKTATPSNTDLKLFEFWDEHIHGWLCRSGHIASHWAADMHERVYHKPWWCWGREVVHFKITARVWNETGFQVRGCRCWSRAWCTFTSPFSLVLQGLDEESGLSDGPAVGLDAPSLFGGMLWCAFVSCIWLWVLSWPHHVVLKTARRFQAIAPRCLSAIRRKRCQHLRFRNFEQDLTVGQNEAKIPGVCSIGLSQNMFESLKTLIKHAVNSKIISQSVIMSCHSGRSQPFMPMSPSLVRTIRRCWLSKTDPSLLGT